MGNTQRKDIDLVLEGFKRNDENVLEGVYRSVFPKVRIHVLNNSGDEAKAKDVFQEAFVACWQNIKDGKFDGKGNIEAYLFTIAKNKWTDHLRSANFKKTSRLDDAPQFQLSEEKELEPEADKEHEIMKMALEQLGSACKNLLILFYFERKKMEDIATELDMAAASVRNKKYRCMEQLRTLAQKIKDNG